MRRREVPPPLGQHFLERQWVDKVIAAIAPAPRDIFIEVGPGRGALTRPLAAHVAHVIAFEIDRRLVADLSNLQSPNLTVVHGDFLRVSVDRVRQALADLGPTGHPVRVAGNLPYGVASPILFRFLELFRAGIALTDATVMLQREVADRLLAEPSTRDYGVLTVRIRHGAEVERLLDLPPGAFRPVPRVRSTLVRLRFHPPDPPPRDPAVFEAVSHAIFTRRRKTLANALMAYRGARPIVPAEVLVEAGLEAVRRPETLEIAELVRLSDVVARREKR